jgi:hypothetical protein
MGRVRVSIAGLMGWIIVFSMAWASIRYASGDVANLTFTATIGVVGVAILGGLFRRGESRAWWAGFALIGGGYLALCYGPGFASEVRPHLSTSALLDRVGPLVVHPRVVTDRRAGPGPSVVVSSVLATPEDILTASPGGAAVLTQINSAWPAHLFYRSVGIGDPEDFQRVGHCWLALLLGLAGGRLARWFHSGPAGPSPVAGPIDGDLGQSIPPGPATTEG